MFTQKNRFSAAQAEGELKIDNLTIINALLYIVENTYQKNGPQSIDKTRDGKNTRIHAITANEKAIVLFHLSRGNLNNVPQGRLLLENLDHQYTDSFVLMDKAYEGSHTRQSVLAQG